MNPELRRNLWLELSASRMALMAGVLGLIFGIAWLSAPEDGDRYKTLATVGETLFGLIVGLWGSFKAGRSVSDEIREKTWDFQRLSALSPASMMLGKLFGATAYVWFGGAITLGGVGYGYAMTYGAGEAFAALGRLILLGVFAHAVALAVSLAVVRRGRGRDRVDAFVYTIAGIAAFQSAESATGVKGTLLRGFEESLPPEMAQPAAVDWMGLALSSHGWAFLMLGALVLWAVGTCWRLMRVELQAPANPVWFAGFLVVPTLLLAGRADTLVEGATVAYFLIHGLVLLTLLLEPKDFVSWRSLMSELGKPARGVGRFWPADKPQLPLQPRAQPPHPTKLNIILAQPAVASTRSQRSCRRCHTAYG